MVNSSGLSTDPWCTSTLTSNFSLVEGPTLTAVVAPSYIVIITFTIHSSTPTFLRAHQTTSRGTLSNAFSRSTKAIQRTLFLARCLSKTNLKQLNDDITKCISDHKTNQWKDKLEQNWDHKQNTHTYSNTLNRLNNKKLPEQTNKNIYFNNKPARTPIQRESKRFQKTIRKHCKTCYQK